MRIGDGCCNRGCTYHAYAGHAFEPLALVASAVLGVNAAFEPTYLLAESYELHHERLQGHPHRFRDLPSTCSNLSPLHERYPFVSMTLRMSDSFGISQ